MRQAVVFHTQQDHIPSAGSGESKAMCLKMQDPDEALKMTRVTFDVATSDTKIQFVPQERIQERIIEEILEIPVSQVMEEAGRVVKHVS